MANLVGIALSGLFAAQRSLETTSHNIANVNTEGYNRQRTELGTRFAEYNGAGYVGTGVNIETIARTYDQFITNQLTASSSAFSESDAYSKLAQRVDSLVANQSTGLAPSLKAFFNAVNEVANDPSSIPVRQVMISEGESLIQHFNTMSNQFDEIEAQANSQLQAHLDDINSYSQHIADLNAKIQSIANRAAIVHTPNDLLDERDAAIAKLSSLVSVTAITQDDGSMSVFFGSGQSLVIGVKAATLSLAGSSTDYDHKEVLINGQVITKQISGGELYGALKFRDEMLEPVQNQLGLVAVGFAVEFNQLHKTGFDLNGVAGKDMFSLGTPTLGVPIVPDPLSTGSASAVYDPATVGQLYPSDYKLSYNGTDYTLTRLSDNTVTTFSALSGTESLTGPGFTISTTGAVAGDSFLIRPTFEAAGKIQSEITDPLEIAAAGANIPGAPAQPIPGNNTVALSLANLEKKTALYNGKTTLSDGYRQLVSKVGTLAHEAKINRSAQEVLLNQAKQSRESLSGVNLDEEAANLIKYQNSYQAAAQAISVAHSLFDTLIGAVR
jgi:flagellar hook-associated protein 1